MRQRNSGSSRGREQPWLLRQFVRPVQPHIGEIVQVPQGLVIGGIIVLMLVSFVILYNLAGRALGTDATPKTTPPAGLVVPSPANTARPPTAPSSASTRVPSVSPVPAATSTRVPPTVVPTTLPIGATAVAPPAAGTKYMVKSGDTLISIAIKFGVSVDSIRTANNIKNDTIYAGEELIIPPPAPR